MTAAPAADVAAAALQHIESAIGAVVRYRSELRFGYRPDARLALHHCAQCIYDARVAIGCAPTSRIAYSHGDERQTYLRLLLHLVSAGLAAVALADAAERHIAREQGNICHHLDEAQNYCAGLHALHGWKETEGA